MTAPRRSRAAGSGGLLIVGCFPPPHHGVATASVLLCRMLDEAQVPYDVIDISDRRGLANIGRMDAGNVVLALGAGARFMRALVSGRPRAVYLPISQNQLGFLRDCLFLVPARLTGRRLIVHLHGSVFRRAYDAWPAWLRGLARWLLRGADRTIVLGESLRPVFDGLVAPDRIAVVPNGLPDPAGGPPPDHAPDEPLTVVYLGNLYVKKGVSDALRAASLVRAEWPDVRFVFAGGAGTAQDRAEVHAVMAEPGLSGAVTMAGVVEGADKTRLLAGADVFVFPPRQEEGHPFVILEAMAVGLPIVTTAKGAIPETVIDGLNGYIVPAGDPARLAAAMLTLLRDPALRARMSAASRARYLRLYSYEAWAARMQAILVPA